MKNLVLALGIFLIAFSTKAQEETVTVNVTIDNVLNDKGTILVSLHSKDSFMKGSGVIDMQEKAKKGTISISFENVVAGEYAVMVLHDENDNKRMDFEANGMPKESYGMSGNSMPMGPPSFADAKFKVLNENLDLSIRF